MSERERTVGLVGPGAIARAHAAAVAAVDGLRLVAVAGRGGEQIAADFGARAFADHAAMLAAGAPDIVVVTTPSGDHFAPAAAALAAGCHVVVEKPLAVDPQEAARLAGLARATNRVCATISQRRYEPAHQAVKALLDSGALGELRLIEADVHWWRSDAYYAEKPWRGEVAQGGGSLFNQGVHSLDLMLFFAGRVERVAAMAATVGHRIDVEDMTAALLRFESGAQGVLVTSTATPPGAEAGLRLFTSRGFCALEQDRIARWTFEGVAAPETTSAGVSGASDPGAIGIVGHVQQWTDIRDAIRASRPAAITFDDGAAAARVVAAIYRAAAEGRHVALAEFPERIAS
ncbi:MAG: Gfo/Idh/MocA family oxidoreductase [Methylobacteriaceae bacterium]|nr:Gfo/Idh/MocA family oxidoreductase [Methylobacteriaceae bacterium]